MTKPKFTFHNTAAKKTFEHIFEEFGDESKYLDEDLLVTYCNLRSQEIELQALVKKEGYRVTNVNSRGGETHQINPTYRAYLSCVAEKNKIYSKINKLLPENDGDLDDFDSF
ncbi:P27 family phage terminase small subunit [Bacillus cihuensis]|uniref:P27 family phage terminase small subunit n=1 Tax=Bacillus cihuensis TaxID=1208599 RepID=UPI0004257B0E|nr:P27 family phage terminase small subunit [Bacillus cihuensis]